MITLTLVPDLEFSIAYIGGDSARASSVLRSCPLIFGYFEPRLQLAWLLRVGRQEEGVVGQHRSRYSLNSDIFIPQRPLLPRK